MNPRDIMQDAIHNFHPQYSQYTQASQSRHAFARDRGKSVIVSSAHRSRRYDPLLTDQPPPYRYDDDTSSRSSSSSDRASATTSHQFTPQIHPIPTHEFMRIIEFS